MEELALPDYLYILKRRKKYFILTSAVLFMASIFFTLSWSNYRSTATIEIDQPEISRDTTNANQNDMQQELVDLRIGKIQQKVTAAASLASLIDKFNLYPYARKYLPMAVLAERMRDKIKVELLTTVVANPAAAQKVPASQLSAIAFDLSFDYGDPLIAQQVTNELVTLFMDEDLKDRRAQAQETSAFLAAQITALESSLAEQEEKISAYQETYGDSRPENLLFNQQAAAAATLSLQTLDSQIAANEGTQGTLGSQLATVSPYSRVIADGQMLTTPAIQLKALQAQYTTLTAQYGPDYPDVIKARHQIEALEKQVGPAINDAAQLKAQIADVSANLEAANKTYGPDHPDVVSLKNQLKSLNDRLAATDKNTAAQSLIKQDADNPAYLQIASQLNAAEEQHRSLLIQRKELVKQLIKYQKAVAQNPAVMQQMAALSRDYDNAQIRYRELKEKKMAADMSLQMEQDRKGQRLTLIEPPGLPLNTHPSRFLLFIAGLVLSIIGGIVGVVLAHQMNQNILGSRHLASLVGTAPMVAIPHIYTIEERERSLLTKRHMIRAAPFAFILSLVIFSYAVMPLGALWGAFIQRLGLS
jgi:uncharacterized protein involved in exopolysaccharide biosynthesis